MDPVSLAVAVDDKAQLPALPDLGSEPTAAAEPTAKASAEPSAAPVAAASDSGRAPAYTAIGGGVLLLAAAGAFFALRRRGAGQGPDADASAGSDAPRPPDAPMRALWFLTPSPHPSLPPPFP
ncbi:HtaA domain-containing protein OS=Streptomyces microflavus OX=1919 GN=HUT09_08855 PE=4 SV=1 [Streptomyces microflavus]